MVREESGLKMFLNLIGVIAEGQGCGDMTYVEFSELSRRLFSSSCLILKMCFQIIDSLSNMLV